MNGTLSGMEPAGNRHRVTGLRAAGPAHAARPLSARTPVLVATVVALVAIAGPGLASLLRSHRGATSTPTSAQLMTVAASFPVGRDVIVDAAQHPPDLGPLREEGRLAACLKGLDLPLSTQPLGARPIEAGGRPAILLVLPGSQAGQLSAVVIRPDCSAEAPGRVSDTTISTP